MGFNFGAALGGFADQVVSDIEDKEKEVKLRTRTILDRHVAETAANRKEYKANKKRVTEQLNSIANYFGADDPDRYNKARAIVAGGDSHVAKMSTAFTQAQMAGQDVNEIYKFTKSDKDVGFKGVEDTTNSLVKLATIAAPSFGASGQTSTLFGGTNLANVYEQGRSQYEKAGLLDAPASMSESGATYGSGQLDLTSLKQDAKSLDQQEANAFDAKRNSTPGSAEYIKAEADLAAIDKRNQQTSIPLQIAKINAEAEAKGDIPSLGGYTTIHTKGLDSITKKYEQKIVTGPDGNIVADPTKKAQLRDAEINSYNKSFVKGLIRNGLDANATDLINATPALAKIQDEVMKELEADIIGKDGEKKEDNSKPKSFFEEQEEILKKKNQEETIQKKKDKFLTKYGDDVNKAATDLINIKKSNGKNRTKKEVFDTLRKIYPDKSEDDIYKIVTDVQGTAIVSDKVVEGVTARPDDGNWFDSPAEDQWDKDYGDTHFKDGKPKPPKKYGTRRKNRSK